MHNDVVFVIVIATALAFDFTNGFHDTANAMATSIATGALRPKMAVALSGLLNLIGAFLSVEVNRLENEGDRIIREALASLFDTGIDPMMVIRWKDIFERLEDAIDATETTANILESIVIKNA